MRSVKFYALLCNQPAPNDFHSPLSPAPGSHHFIFYHYDSYKKNHTVFVLLWGPCFISYNVSKFHPILACQNSPPVLRLRDSPLGMHTKFCWPIDPSMSRGHFHLLALRWLWRVWILDYSKFSYLTLRGAMSSGLLRLNTSLLFGALDLVSPRCWQPGRAAPKAVWVLSSQFRTSCQRRPALPQPFSLSFGGGISLLPALEECQVKPWETNSSSGKLPTFLLLSQCPHLQSIVHFDNIVFLGFTTISMREYSQGWLA